MTVTPEPERTDASATSSGPAVPAPAPHSPDAISPNAITPDAVLDVVAEEASIDRDSLQPQATLESLGVASIDLVSILFTLEDRFGLVIDTAELKGASTLQDVVDVVMAKSRTQAQTASGAT